MGLDMYFPTLHKIKWVPEVKMSQGQNFVVTPQSGEPYRHTEVRLLSRKLTILAYHHRMLTKPANLLMVGKSAEDRVFPQWCRMPNT